MLVIRLARHGRKNWPTYRLVLQEKDWSPNSTAIETLGHLDPHTSPAAVTLKKYRIQHWLSKGAQPSNTVHNLFIEQGILTGKKLRVVTGKKDAVEATPVAEAPAA